MIFNLADNQNVLNMYEKFKTFTRNALEALAPIVKIDLTLSIMTT